MTSATLRRLEGEVLRDLLRRSPCGCGRCRVRAGLARHAAEGADVSPEGALAGLGRAGSAATRGAASVSRWPRPPAGFASAAARTLAAMGWSGWRRPRASLALLQRFAKAGAEPKGGKRVRYDVTDKGRALLDTPRFAALKPLFSPPPPGTRSVYDVGHPVGGRVRSDYVGVTNRLPGVRLIEHLNDPRSDLHKGLHAPGAPRLSQEVVRIGHASGRQHRAHAAEVLLQELLRPSWNSPDKHGFDA